VGNAVEMHGVRIGIALSVLVLDDVLNVHE
jgi:hypothetical protein